MESTGGTGPGHREVRLTRTALGEYDVVNPRGGRIHLGPGDSEDFTPVELFLASIVGCSAVDVDHLTSRQSEPVSFDAIASGEKVRDADGNRMEQITVSFRLRFPDGPAGDAARSRIAAGIRASHERLCTVSRTIQAGAPVTMQED